MPMPLDLRRIDEGVGIENTLVVNKAKWHKYCLSKFSATRIQRAEKRKAGAADQDPDGTQQLESITVKVINRLFHQRIFVFSARKYPQHNHSMKHLPSA